MADRKNEKKKEKTDRKKEAFETDDVKNRVTEEDGTAEENEAAEEAAEEAKKPPKKEGEAEEAASEGEGEPSEADIDAAAPGTKKDRKDALIEDLQDKVKRQMAEFENFRKRTDKEKTQMFDAGSKNVIEKILPVLDNFERGLSGAAEGDAFAEGMSMIYKQLLTAFEQLGVKEIEAVGQPFDPELHNAVMHIDDESFGENEIVEVLQKGYTFHDSVVRHSMVKVAN